MADRPLIDRQWIGGRLVPVDSAVQSSDGAPPPRRGPQAHLATQMHAGLSTVMIYDPANYSNPQSNQWVIASAPNPTLVAPGASGLRNLLVVTNTDPANAIGVSLNGPMAFSVCPIFLAPGGVVLFDRAVPQTDIYLIAGAGTANATVTVSYVAIPGLGG